MFKKYSPESERKLQDCIAQLQRGEGYAGNEGGETDETKKTHDNASKLAPTVADELARHIINDFCVIPFPHH